MDFVLRMTFRELRASWRRLVFFFLSVAVGVGGIEGGDFVWSRAEEDRPVLGGA